MIDKEFLYEEYVIKKRSAKDIGMEVEKSDTQVRYWVKKYNFPMNPRGGTLKTKDLTNQKFGSLTVIKQVKGDGDCAKWQCKCDCGNLHLVKSPYLRRGEIKSCGNCKEHWNWQGVGELSGHYYSTLIQNAKKRNLEFNISKQFLWNLFLKQNRKCSLSGEQIFFKRSYGTKNNNEQTASLDRIDNSKGYIESNVQWVHKDINRIKREYNEDIFLEWVYKIYRNKIL